MKLLRIFILAFFAAALIACGGAEERKAVYMEKAMASIESGDLDKARIELKNVLQIDPKDSYAYYQLGKIFESKKEYRKAYSNYLKAEELDPELLENQARLGRIYLLLPDKAAEAQKKIDLILSKEPNNSDGLLLKAAVLLKNKKADEAISLMKKIVAQDPEHVESVIFLATIHLRNKNYREAINVLDDALVNNKNNETLNRLLAVALTNEKDYERAEIIYKNFLEKNPNNSSSYNNLAIFYNQVGDKEKAEEILRAAINNDPSDESRILTLIQYIKKTKSINEAIEELKSYVNTNKQLGSLRLALASLYILNDDKKSAEAVFNEAINDFSDEVTGISARTGLVSIYIGDKDYDKAAEVIKDAISISPNDPQINFLRSKFAVRDKDYETAIISLRIVTKEMPENIEAFLLLASIYQQEGEAELAKSALNTAYENNKINADALLKLAQYHLLRDIKQAEKIIDIYNNIKGPNYDGLSIKAAILNKNKQQSEAYEIAKTLIDLYPDRPAGYLQEMPYYSQKNDKKKAIAVLEKGYLTAKDNRKLLILLTALQVKEGEYDIVEKRLKAELSVAPDDVQLKILLAQMYLVSKDVASAEIILKEIVETSPETEESYLLLSEIYSGKKDLQSLISILVKGKEHVASSVKIPFRLANTYDANNEHKKAINIYADLQKAHPENLIITNNLVSMLSDYGNNKEDLELAKTLLPSLEDSGQPVFLDTAGWLYYKVGDYKKAIQYLAEAAEKSPKVNVFNYHLGMAYKMSGDSAQAKLYLEKSLVDGESFKQKSLAEAAIKEL